MSSDCTVHISGIRSQSEDEIVIFLESRRFCPSGGTVSHFVQISEDEAVVIFEDSQVANRLHRQLILLDGTKISAEPHREFLRRKLTSLETESTARTATTESDSCSGNRRGKNKSSRVETSGNGNHKSRDHHNSSGSSEMLCKWSVKSKSNTHLNETPCSPTYGDGQSTGQGRFSRIDSCDSYKSEASVSRESSRSSSRSSSSRDRKRTNGQGMTRKTHDKHDGRLKSGKSSKEPQSSFRYPKHWSYFTSVKQPAGILDHKRSELTPGSGDGIFEEVSRLVMKTWEPQKVGHGNDAAGLGAHTIKIRRIFCIENPSLYRPYMSQREEFCNATLVNKCHRVNGLQGEREIMTLKLGLKQLDAALASQVNECYLLHGTKHDMIDSIESTGLDSRLSGRNVLFGPGTYLTESSTKADQYADAKNQRIRNGQPLHMYVCRVLLGHTFVCQTPKPFKRAPCMQAGCYSDICPSKHPFVGNFDSVIGTHKNPTVRLLFREFVIYHPDQSYPEFLVEYERQ